MDEEMSARIKSVLENPEMLEKIVSAVSAFSGGASTGSNPSGAVRSDYSPQEGAEASKDKAQGEPDSRAASILSALSMLGSAGQAGTGGGSSDFSAVPTASLPSALSGAKNSEYDSRIALLYALKPFLSEKRRQKIDSVSRALSIASIYRQAKNL